MAAANASARGQRAAILASPLSELIGFNLSLDCLSPGCARERTFAVTDLATFYGGSRTVGEVLRRMRCSGACGGRVGAAWLVTGPVLTARVRPRRVALLGPDARESTAETIGWRLFALVGYDKHCRSGGALTLNDLAETSEMGDWRMTSSWPVSTR
jgi:hypothetical protein